MNLLYNLCWNSFLVLVLISCNKGAERPVVAKTESSAPDVLVHKGDSLLVLDTTGVLLYKRMPFSGFLLSENIGGVKVKEPFIRGLKEGEGVGYYPDSSLCFKRMYRNGEKHGLHEGWYSSGSLRFQYLFKEGLSEGNHKEWYGSGKLCKDLNYKNGKPLGSQKEWFMNGKLKANYVVRENGRKYGLTGVKRCDNINTAKEVLTPIKKK